MVVFTRKHRLYHCFFNTCVDTNERGLLIHSLHSGCPACGCCLQCSWRTTWLYCVALESFLARLYTRGAGVHVCVSEAGRGGEERFGGRGVLLLLPLTPNSVRSEEGTEETKPAHEPRDGALWQFPSWSIGSPWDWGTRHLSTWGLPVPLCKQTGEPCCWNSYLSCLPQPLLDALLLTFQ